MGKLHSKLFLFATISLIAISYNVDVFAEDERLIEFLEDSYPYHGTAVIRVTDSDMDVSSDVETVDVGVASDADIIGTTITLHETDSSSGIFEGTVFFVLDDSTSGHRLQVVQGGEIYAVYEDLSTDARIEETPSPITDTAELEEISASPNERNDDNGRSGICSQLGGIWNDEHGICNYVGETYCDTMGGQYQQCLEPEFRCPVDRPNCSLDNSCIQSCVFDESIKSEKSLTSAYPICDPNNPRGCDRFHDQFYGDDDTSPKINISTGNNVLSRMLFNLENAALQNVSFIDEDNTPTLILDIDPRDDGHLLIEISTYLFYPDFMAEEAKYHVYIDGMESEFLQHSFYNLEIPFSKENKEIRIGGQMKGIDLITNTTEYLHVVSEEDYGTKLRENIPKATDLERAKVDPNLSLKSQLDFETNPNNIVCPNPDHVLTKRIESNSKNPDSAYACVKPATADKLGWYVFEK